MNNMATSRLSYLILQALALDVEHGKLEQPFQPSKQPHGFLEGVGIAKPHVRVNTWPADQGDKQAARLALFSATDREIVLHAPAVIDGLDVAALIEASLCELGDALGSCGLGFC